MDSQEYSSITGSKASILCHSAFLIVQLSHPYMTTGKTIALTIWTYVGKVHWKDWCWSLSSNTLVTWCKEQTHWKRSWCWERLKVGAEGDERGKHGWMASLTQWTWVWASTRRWWRTGNLGILQSMGSQRVWHNWATEQFLFLLT